MTTITTLRNAQGLLRRDGWQMDSYGPLSPGTREPRCLVGAVRAAAGGLNNDRAEDALSALLTTLPDADDMEHWNDAPGRTETEVHDLLDRTIQRLETL